MYAKPPKKLLILNILDILQKRTDENHRLSQKDIVDILHRDYEMDVDRKAVKRNLMDLIECGYDLEYTEHVRTNKRGEEVILTDFYINRDFSDAELRLLIDSVLFSRHIPRGQCKQLIEKIRGLSSEHFRTKVRHVCNLPDDVPQNPELFYSIEILDEAIEAGRQVRFHYADLCTDKKYHLRLSNSGKPRSYLVNPYQMVANNGRYYLIGNIDKYDNVSHYRVDRIRDIELLAAPAKPQRQVKGLENGLNLPKHMAEHVYMFDGESQHITMRTSPGMAGELMDWFGNSITFTEETEDSVIAHVTASTEAMRFWALQYAPYVTILGPQKLVDMVKKDLQTAVRKYAEER